MIQMLLQNNLVLVGDWLQQSIVVLLGIFPGIFAVLDSWLVQSTSESSCASAQGALNSTLYGWSHVIIVGEWAVHACILLSRLLT
jgi:hypothetical protein